MTAKLHIEFPCVYPITIIGNNINGIEDFVIKTIHFYCEDFTGDIKKRLSKNGKYISIRVEIVAQGETHLTQLHQTLKENQHIHTVL